MGEGSSSVFGLGVGTGSGSVWGRGLGFGAGWDETDGFVVVVDGDDGVGGRGDAVVVDRAQPVVGATVDGG